jgi:hypothetical protein
MLPLGGDAELSTNRAAGSVMLSLAFCATLGACGTTGQNAGQAVRRSADQFKSGFGGAVTAPFEDLNIKRDEIPPVLVHAVTAPYDLAGLDRCEKVAAEVGALDYALGPDLDEPKAPPRTRLDRAADFTAKTGLNAVRDTTTDVIPFRSWVRRLSGAERHRREVQDAVKAGTMRRSFLKAIGMNMNCAPPAAPKWFVPTDRVADAPAPKLSAGAAGAADVRLP